MPVPPVKLLVGGTSLQVEIAGTPARIEHGLSGRESLPGGQGMLFVFDRPGLHPFWMKDMHFPIDIVWIAAEKKVVGVTENVTPDTYPQTFWPSTPVRYVLEVNAGGLEEKQIKVGDAVVWED